MRRTSRTIVCSVVVVLACSTATGCGLTAKQQAAVLKFSAATSAFGKLAKEEFVRARTDVIEMNRLALELGDTPVNPDDDLVLDGSLKLSFTQDRIAALEALEEYAQLLEALTTTSYGAGLRQASDSFVSGLGKVKGVKLEDHQAEAIGKAVELVGGLFLEYKRSKAIRRVVKLAHPHILKTTDLVMHDFDTDSDGWAAGYRRGTLDLRAATALAAAKVQPNDVAGSQLVRQARLLSVSNLQRFSDVSARIIEAADRLAAAQRDLRYLVRSKEMDVEDLDLYVNYVTELVSVYELLRGGSAQ